MDGNDHTLITPLDKSLRVHPYSQARRMAAAFLLQIVSGTKQSCKIYPCNLTHDWQDVIGSTNSPSALVCQDINFSASTYSTWMISNIEITHLFCALLGAQSTASGARYRTGIYCESTPNPIMTGI